MTLRKPPLHDVHEERGASFTEFGGWEMPVDFGSIRDEHNAVRESVGIFDVSHMGEIRVSGSDASQLMQCLTTNDVDELSTGECHYSLITDEDGVMLDDTIVYRTDDGYLFVPNAGHDDEMFDRWTRYRDERGFDAEVENVTDGCAMFAVQGPDSSGAVENAVGDADDLGGFEWKRVGGAMVSRTGYTGEDGFEIILDAADAADVWNRFDCPPCGLGARDTLRLEMGFLLSGQDFDPEENPRNPYEAGVGFAVDLGADFVGRDALEDVEVEEHLVGFELLDRGVPRHGYEIRDGERVGEVTSGTVSPTLGKPIGLGYVPVEYSDGDEFDVVIRDEPKKARITPTPFLKRER